MSYYPLTSKSISPALNIKEVWHYNLEEEFYKIMDLIEEYNYISLDTEFPGVVYNNSENEYNKIKENVEKLKIIQIGFTIGKENSLYTNDFYTWQFNFKFDQRKDSCAAGSIKFLTNAGINFEKLESDGIETHNFAELLISSGLILNDDLQWVSFHGGFDFGYLLRILLSSEMPNNLKLFYANLKLYFPEFVDLKYVVRNMEDLKIGGLSRLASELNVDRIGEEHQAGSDSLLTLAVFLKLKEKYTNLINDKKNQNIIYALVEGDEEEGKDYYSDYYTNLNDYMNSYYNNCNLNGFGNIMGNFYQNNNYPLYNNYNDVIYKGFQFTDDGSLLNGNMNQKTKKFK